jgi:hypothetical protein
MHLRVQLILATVAFSAVALAQNPITADAPFQVRYASNLNIGDSVVNITNDGASGGSICANLYTFDPAEELVSCCTCVVTPNALVSLSVIQSLTSNPLTPAIPTSVVIKLLSTTTGTCNASTEGILVPGLLAWGTTLHLNTSTAAPTYYGTETAFSPGSLSAAEYAHITAFCGFIQANGSGFGICKGCATGGLGGTKQ